MRFAYWLLLMALAGCGAITPPTPTPCPFTWSQEDYPDLTADYRARLEAEGLTVAAIRVYGAGERSCDAFVPMQTDFNVTITHDANATPDALAALVTETLTALAAVPIADTPGPNAGRVQLNLRSDVSSRGLTVSLADVVAYLDGDQSRPMVDVLGLREQLLFVQ